MSLSFNQKLFLQINSQIGKRPWFDSLMYVCAHWLIYVLGFLAMTWGEIMLPDVEFKIFIKLILTTIVISMTVSFLQALVWRHPRPIKQLPETKLLFQPIENWKSFPSDHTMASFIFVFLTYLAGASIFSTTVLAIMATIVAISRVYSGVHYPRDIVGGFVAAIIFALGSFWLVTNITQPIYNLLLTIL